MGKDIYEVNEYKWYFRALETRDEYIEYYRKRHALWRIYGFQLRTSVRGVGFCSSWRDTVIRCF